MNESSVNAKETFMCSKVNLFETSSAHFNIVEDKKGVSKLAEVVRGPWKVDERELKPCWNRPVSSKFHCISCYYKSQKEFFQTSK